MRTAAVRSWTLGTLTSNCLLESLSMEGFEECAQGPAAKTPHYVGLKHFRYPPVW